MKDLKKILFVAIGLFGFMACSGSSGSMTEEELIIEEIETGHQKTSFLLTDAPSDDFKSVYVDILSPIVATTDQGDVNIPLPDGLPIRVDLLALNGVSDLLTSHLMPAGTLQKITLTLSKPEIVLLKDTVLDASKIAFTSVLTITPDPIVVSEKQGATVEIDIDVEKSVQFNPTKGDLIFKPQGSVRRLGAADPGIEVRDIVGTVAAVPGIKGQPTSFLLRHPERQFFIPVNASGAMIYNPEATRFDAIVQSQRVRVSGVFTGEGVLKARRVSIIPENHQVLRGIITNLNQIDPILHTLDLRLLHDRESGTSSTTTVTYNPVKTPIRLERPNMLLQSGDLTEGQVVGVHGLINVEGRFESQVIFLHPEKFLGFVANKPDCAQQPLFHLFYPPRLAHRLSLAGIKNKSNVSIVEVGEKMVDLQGQDIPCSNVYQGMAVHIFGYMMPPLPNDPLTPRVKALEIREGDVKPLVGEVTKIANDGSHFVISVPAAEIGFSRDGMICTDCLVDIIVKPPVLLDRVNGLQVNKKVRVIGFFESDISSLTTVRDFFLQAVVIEKVL